jgi:hypothetical protein
MRKVYLASSWRNLMYPIALKRLRDAGHEVHDFREGGFQWKELHSEILEMQPIDWLKQIRWPRAKGHFELDKTAMEWADTCVIVERAGNSAHVEAGWMKGQGKDVHVFLPPFCDMEAELMILLFEPNIWLDWTKLIKALSSPPPAAPAAAQEALFWDQVREEAIWARRVDDLAPETVPPGQKIQKQG